MSQSLGPGLSICTHPSSPTVSLNLSQPDFECCSCTVSLWKANYQGCPWILKSPSFISNMHTDPHLWWKTRSADIRTSKSQPYSNVFILILLIAGLIIIQVLKNQRCRRHATHLPELWSAPPCAQGLTHSSRTLQTLRKDPPTE